MGDSVAVAEELKTQYEAFLESIEVNLRPEMHRGCSKVPLFQAEILW